VLPRPASRLVLTNAAIRWEAARTSDMKSRTFRLLSFSGIDGAGKSTQIEALLQHLQEQGHRFQLFTFWDDAVAFSKYREHLSLRVFKGEKGVGSPDRPIARRDKNVTSWYVVLFRLFLYIFDALRLSAVVSSQVAKDVEFVIFDRYIYDELVNLPFQHWPVRLYVRLLLRIVPSPDSALLLDADPEKAVSRKPEYPLEFVRRNRHAYLNIANIAGMTVLPPSSISETTEIIRKSLLRRRRDADSTVFPRRQALTANSAKTPSG
jgi:thymidylate kinase